MSKIEQRYSRQPRPRPLRPADVLKRIPQSPDDIKLSLHIPTSELTPQGHLKTQKIQLIPRKPKGE